MNRLRILALVILLGSAEKMALADPPGVAYIFPAGGQRGTTVDVRVGAFDLTSKAFFEVLGAGVRTGGTIQRTETTWLEGPVLQQPESVEIEEYPKDYAGRISIDAGTQTGPRAWRIWNSEGASGSLPFIVGDLPEVVEIEREESGNPLTVSVTLPVTANGRIFPREDIDLWSFSVRAGEIVNAQATVAQIGSTLEPWIEAVAPSGKTLADVIRWGSGDPGLTFVAPETGTYTLRVVDVGNMGSQRHLYRLTLTKGPRIAWTNPLGGRRGSVVSFLTGGPAFGETREVLTLPVEGLGDGPSRVEIRFPTLGVAPVEIDDLAETSEAEPNDTARSPSIGAVPGVFNGTIGHAADEDIWSFAMTSNRSYCLDLRAARLGSELDPILKVTDREGKVLGTAEGTVAAGGDPILSFRAETSGIALVHVRDRFHSRGGPALGYRLRITEQASPDFSLALDTDTLSLTRGKTAKLKVTATRLGGLNEPIELDLEGLPSGVSAPSPHVVIDAKHDSAEIVLKTDSKAPIRSTLVTVRGKAKVHDQTIEHVAARAGNGRLPAIDSVRMAVGLNPPFELTGPIDFSSSPRGTIHHHPFHIKATGCVGPIEVRIADRQIRHQQGVIAPVVQIPPGTTDFDFAITLPPWMETGRTSRTVLTTSAIVREPDGTEHEVNHTWPDNVHQLVTVVGPGLMTLQASPSLVPLGPGRHLDLAVKLTRGKEVKGPATIRLHVPWMVQGLSAELLTIPKDADSGTLRLSCSTEFHGPPSAEIALVATSAGPVPNDPVTAQTTITILTEDITTSATSTTSAANSSQSSSR
jgi:hypothetical protein